MPRLELQVKVLGEDGRIRCETIDTLTLNNGGELVELALFHVADDGARMPIVVLPFTDHGTGLHTWCRGPEDPTLFSVVSG